MSRVAAAVTLLLLTGCAADAPAAAMVPSSFTGLTERIDDRGAVDTEWIIAGSSRLVRQLADGADADVLVTADEETMRTAVAQGLVAGDPVVVAGNRLVLALAPGNPGGIDGLADLADPARLLGVCAAEVPCGRLALDATTTLGVDLAVDTEEPSVRALALKISRGELDAGLVYATDALDLGLATVDDDRLAPFATEYFAATPGGGDAALVDFLRSPDGRALLTDEGFTVP